MSWTTATTEAEVWSAAAVQTESWSPSSEQSETWTSLAPEIRVFSPEVFSLAPTFDTGSPAGVWTDRTRQAEVWA